MPDLDIVEPMNDAFILPQILREINFAELRQGRAYEWHVLAILEVQNFDFGEIVQFFKARIY